MHRFKVIAGNRIIHERCGRSEGLSCRGFELGCIETRERESEDAEWLLRRGLLRMRKHWKLQHRMDGDGNYVEVESPRGDG